MIYVFQDQTKIPTAWLEKVEALQVEMDTLQDADARKAFIDRHSRVWGEIKNHLLEMSAGKCWYTEAPDAVSDWHVDHFRPKKRALDADKTEHEGYYWLAFDWKNYRIAGSYPNSPHRDQAEVTRGKWDYFPLAGGSPRASWENRDCSVEQCLLLDPINPDDPKLMTFDETGYSRASAPEVGVIQKRVETTVNCLNLDSVRLVRARQQKWRETAEWIEELREASPTDPNVCTPNDYARVDRVTRKLSELTAPVSPYAATARACLEANGLSAFVKRPEEANIAA